MSPESILTLLMFIVVTSAIGFCLGLIFCAAYWLLRFVCLHILPAPWRLARYFLDRRLVDRRVAEIQAIGAQARQEMEELTDEYLKLFIHQ